VYDISNEMAKNNFNDYVGEMGTYQLRVCAVIFLYTMFAVDVTQFIFVAAHMAHWCLVPELVDLPPDVQKNVAIPTASVHSTVDHYHDDDDDEDDSTIEYSSCEMFSLNYSAYNRTQIYSWNRSEMISNDTPVVQCSQWTYDQSLFSSTIVKKVRLKRDGACIVINAFNFNCVGQRCPIPIATCTLVILSTLA